MTRLFDGVAGLLADSLGASVRHRPVGGDPAGIQSVFRTDPIEVLGADGGPALISQPTWRVPADRAAGIKPEDLIEPWDGKTYRVVNRIMSGSPGADRFHIFALELVA